MSRDNRTGTADREGVDLIVPGRPARPRSAGWLTGVRLAWAAAVVVFATAALAALGRGISPLVGPSELAWPRMGCVLLARRPDHPMGRLLCLVGLAAAISDLAYAYQGYTLLHPPGPVVMLPGHTANNRQAVRPQVLQPSYQGEPCRPTARSGVAWCWPVGASQTET